jgi:hypothetical protein
MKQKLSKYEIKLHLHKGVSAGNNMGVYLGSIIKADALLQLASMTSYKTYKQRWQKIDNAALN